jgi:hypothetical protein
MSLMQWPQQLFHREGGLAGVKQPTYGEPADFGERAYMVTTQAVALS